MNFYYLYLQWCPSDVIYWYDTHAELIYTKQILVAFCSKYNDDLGHVIFELK